MQGLDDAVLADLIRGGIAALGDYRQDLVLIGGLAPSCYRWLPGYEDMGLSPCGTMDVDLAIEPRVSVRAGRTIRSCLEGGGFTNHEGPGFDRRPGKQTFSLSPGQPGIRGQLPDPWPQTSILRPSPRSCVVLWQRLHLRRRSVLFRSCLGEQGRSSRADCAAPGTCVDPQSTAQPGVAGCSQAMTVGGDGGAGNARKPVAKDLPAASCH